MEYFEAQWYKLYITDRSLIDFDVLLYQIKLKLEAGDFEQAMQKPAQLIRKEVQKCTLHSTIYDTLVAHISQQRPQPNSPMSQELRIVVKNINYPEKYAMFHRKKYFVSTADFPQYQIGLQIGHAFVYYAVDGLVHIEPMSYEDTIFVYDLPELRSQTNFGLLLVNVRDNCMCNI